MLRALMMLIGCLVPIAPAFAQAVRGSVTNTARYIEIRPIARDTVDAASVTLGEDGRREFEGRPVFCVAGTCTYYRPEPVRSAIISAHDIAFTTWGYGVQGLSATVMLRVRTELGDFTWPRYDDAFDAILVYADFNRSNYRIRAGRQRMLSGLGFYSFDGLSALYDAGSGINIEAYAGRSLARALEQPRHDALAGLEEFLPDEQAWLIGASADFSHRAGNASLRYQREIWGDRSALVSERAAVDVSTPLLRPVQITGGADYDVAYGRVGKAHLTARLPLDSARVVLELSGRRYLPFFELWTIWGVFSPVAYHEAELQAGWAARPGLDISARAALRSYQDADASVFIAGARDAARLYALRAQLRPSARISVGGEARLEDGFGGYLGSGELNVTWQPSPRFEAGIYGTAFQQILEFRTGEAVVYGLGGLANFELNRQLRLGAGGTLYVQNYDNRPSALDWNQKRAWLSLDWRFGRDPGLAAR